MSSFLLDFCGLLSYHFTLPYSTAQGLCLHIYIPQSSKFRLAVVFIGIGLTDSRGSHLTIKETYWLCLSSTSVIIISQFFRFVKRFFEFFSSEISNSTQVPFPSRHIYYSIGLAICQVFFSAKLQRIRVFRGARVDPPGQAGRLKRQVLQGISRCRRLPFQILPDRLFH